MDKIKRTFLKFTGLIKVETRLDEVLEQHAKIEGDVRNMRQRLESLKRIVTSVRHGGEADEF